MSLQYIIDGYNVIRHPEFPLSRSKDPAPCAVLLKQIKLRRLCGSPKNRIIIVLDGYAPGEEGCARNDIAQIIFSGDETADERIKKILEKPGNPADIVVVSDDREIRFFARASGARVLGVEEFISPHRAPVNGKKEILKPELTNEQVSRINRELEERWLNKK